VEKGLSVFCPPGPAQGNAALNERTSPSIHVGSHRRTGEQVAATPITDSHVASLCRWLLMRRLSRLEHGAVRVHDDRGTRTLGVAGAEPAVNITVHDPAFYRLAAFGGSIGAGEAYIRGYWHTDDLTLLVRLMVRNRDLLDDMEGGAASVRGVVSRVLHWMRKNSRQGSHRNIAAHYDLGNDLFELFLDRRMMYSCALFDRPGLGLDEAQEVKLERICQWLDLRPGERVIEIGTGWGGFAIHAAARFGCHVTTATISRAQHDLARRRVAEAGLEDQVEVLLCDYRDLEGSFDKLVSIEMIEAVGHEFLDTFFRKCTELLKPEGAMFLQAITIEDHRYERALKSVDFIQRFVFPGGFLPSLSAMQSSMARATDLRVLRVEDIGQHYAETVRLWRERFMTRLDRVRELGYDEQFARLWEFYLCYCEGGFLERAISDVHLLLGRPASNLCAVPAFVPART